jgi:hypothetical protein
MRALFISIPPSRRLPEPSETRRRISARAHLDRKASAHNNPSSIDSFQLRMKGKAKPDGFFEERIPLIPLAGTNPPQADHLLPNVQYRVPQHIAGAEYADQHHSRPQNQPEECPGQFLLVVSRFRRHRTLTRSRWSGLCCFYVHEVDSADGSSGFCACTISYVFCNNCSNSTSDIALSLVRESLTVSIYFLPHYIRSCGVEEQNASAHMSTWDTNSSPPLRPSNPLKTKEKYFPRARPRQF